MTSATQLRARYKHQVGCPKNDEHWLWVAVVTTGGREYHMTLATFVGDTIYRSTVIGFRVHSRRLLICGAPDSQRHAHKASEFGIARES
jgi:hypothetical protein